MTHDLLTSLEKPLAKIRKFFRTHRRLPTYQELADMLGYASKNASYKLAQKLIEAGFLEKDDTGKLIPKRLFSPSPATGIIKAGLPIPIEQELVDTVSFDEFLINKPEATFVLKVSGDSMIEAGIMPEDLVLVEKIHQAKPGQIVVANIDEEWTLKYYERQNGKVVLLPANKKYQPIYPQQSLEIAGVVISVIRKYN